MGIKDLFLKSVGLDDETLLIKRQEVEAFLKRAEGIKKQIRRDSDIAMTKARTEHESLLNSKYEEVLNEQRVRLEKDFSEIIDSIKLLSVDIESDENLKRLKENSERSYIRGVNSRLKMEVSLLQLKTSLWENSASSALNRVSIYGEVPQNLKDEIAEKTKLLQEAIDTKKAEFEAQIIPTGEEKPRSGGFFTKK